MRIPLDYYRILGLPIQATHEQLRQAHRDRTLQLPRREYSEAAISARKQLLDQAHSILSSSEHRQSYDASFLAKTYDQTVESDLIPVNGHPLPPATDPSISIDPHTPSIEIDDQQFIGALLILQELGEYELVLKLGRPFLTGGSASLKDGRYGDPSIVFSDVVLTVALACLELGREQWQQNQYENAAEALETGQQLLLREGVFINVRGEIQSDLYRLRPYRVLELLSLPEEYLEERQVGMGLLQDMLRERGGIDGTETDHSGLNMDDFLRFIQQLRNYLTAEEQQYLFEQEASRPSAVATYLAVYALLARGFADHQPALVQKAKTHLTRIGGRQDVYLEQAICALLLGQTEAASSALAKSQEQESIAFIRQHSQDSPDWLPGLCLYSDRWFQAEVFPHFRDLTQSRASLKDYFADRRVQTYLEELPSTSEAPAPVQERPAAPTRGALRDRVAPLNLSTPQPPTLNESVPPPLYEEDLQSLVGAQNGHSTADSSDHDALIAVAKARISARQSGTAILDPDRNLPHTVSTAERVTAPTPDVKPDPSSRSPSQRLRGQEAGSTHSGDGGDLETMPPRRVGDRPLNNTRLSRLPGWFLPVLGLFGIFTLALLGAWFFKHLQFSSQQGSQADAEILVQLDKPLIAQSLSESDPTLTATIDNDAAKLLIDSWLAAKSKALGQTHQIDALDQILADPSLAKWRADAEDMKRSGEYRVYKHDVKIETVEMSRSAVADSTPDSSPSPSISTSPLDTGKTSPAASGQPLPVVPIGGSPDATINSTKANSGTSDQAKVIANVKETTEIFRDGKSEGASPPEELKVQYNLIRKDGKWRVQDWQIL